MTCLPSRSISHEGSTCCWSADRWDSPGTRAAHPEASVLSFGAAPPDRRQISYSNLAEPRQAEEAQEIMKNKLGDCRGAYIFTNTIFR